MNWYKKAQKIPTMENIIWAIDKLLAENYEFTTEDFMQASQGQGEQQYALPKAAQVKTKNKPREGIAPKLNNLTRTLLLRIFDLFETGLSTMKIAKELNILTETVSRALKDRYGSKRQQTEYLREKFEKNIVNVTEDLTQKMRNDFNIYSVTFKEISKILDVEESYIQRTLTRNGINILNLVTDRKNMIAKNISNIVNNSSEKIQQLSPGKLQEYVIAEFGRLYKFRLSKTSVVAAVRFNNLGEYNKNDPDAIFKSFTHYMNGIIQGGRSIFFEQPEKLPIYIDKFFQRYGELNGFLPLKERRSLKLYLTKIQMEENTKNMEKHKYTPVDYSDNNPATFLYDRD
jgi:predicted transcriptional regulator